MGCSSSHSVPDDSQVKENADIVLVFSYEYREGMREEVRALLDKLITYYSENGFFEGPER